MTARIAELTQQLDSLGDPASGAGMLRLLRLLFAVGREDLPLGRLFEGHVDAVQIVMRYARDEQRARVAALVARGGTLGVWNADLPGEALSLTDMRLSGGKSFASGAGLISHALVTVDAQGGRQLVLVDMARTGPAIDRGAWQVAGMQRSESHVVRWEGAAVTADDLIGVPGDYVREPWFVGGALRFAAVQAGGIAAVVEHARDHLVTAERASDPHQAGRLAAMYGLANFSRYSATSSVFLCWGSSACESSLRWMMFTAPSGPITAISAVGQARFTSPRMCLLLITS